MTSIDDLYKHYETLDGAKESAAEHETEYCAIIESARNGPPNEKRLASQFIVKFHRFFPSLKPEVLDVLIALCESSDDGIRRHAIKDVEIFCRDSPELCGRTAEVLTTLLSTQDSTDVTLIHKALVTLLKAEAKGVLEGMFKTIADGNDEARERVLTFLATKIKVLIVDEVLTKELEETLIEHCRGVLTDVSEVQFVLIMHLLTALPSVNTATGQRQLLGLIIEQADLDEPFDPDNADAVDRLMQCIKEAMPLFGKALYSTQFVDYICTRVLPFVGESISEAVTLDLLKALAEMSTHMSGSENGKEQTNLEVTKRCVAAVFTKLIDNMPLPKNNQLADDDNEEEPKFQFSYIECLLYTFHQLARHCPEFLTGEAEIEKLKDFRLRLQYLARFAMMYVKRLRELLTRVCKAGSASMQTDENKFKTLALKTANNIYMICRDLIHNPPNYKAIVVLSFKVVGATPGAVRRTMSDETEVEAKRRAIASGDGGRRDERKMYAPPSGKFSRQKIDFPVGGGGENQVNRSEGGKGFRQRGNKRW